MAHICIIDCAINHSSEICAQRLSQELTKKITLHRPPQDGMGSLRKDRGAELYIIFGSASDVHERLAWQRELAQFCRERLVEGQRVFGICFGHQLMADAFGGSVFKADATLKGKKQIKILKNIAGLKTDQRFTLFVAHSYQVDPKSLGELELLASSESCPVEALYHPRLPYLGVQGHPEGSLNFYEQDIAPEVILKSDEVDLCLKDGIELIRTIVQGL